MQILHMEKVCGGEMGKPGQTRPDQSFTSLLCWLKCLNDKWSPEAPLTHDSSPLIDGLIAHGSLAIKPCLSGKESE